MNTNEHGYEVSSSLHPNLADLAPEELVLLIEGLGPIMEGVGAELYPAFQEYMKNNHEIPEELEDELFPFLSSMFTLALVAANLTYKLGDAKGLLTDEEDEARDATIN